MNMNLIRPVLTPEVTFGDKSDRRERATRALKLGAGAIGDVWLKNQRQRFEDYGKRDDEVIKAKKALSQQSEALYVNFSELMDGGPTIFQAPAGEDGRVTARAFRQDTNKANGGNIDTSTIWHIDISSPGGKRSALIAHVDQPRPDLENSKYQRGSAYTASVLPVNLETGEPYGRTLNSDREIDEVNTATYALQLLNEAGKEKTLLAQPYPDEKQAKSE
jgi:hypothetical protein